MKGLRIALIHNLKPAEKPTDLPMDYYSECDSLKTVAAIAKALGSAGHTVLLAEANRALPQWLTTHPVDLAFNIAEGFHGEARESRVPALLDLMEIPYTGSGVCALALALDKAKSKQIFSHVGIPTPRFQLFLKPDDEIDKRLHFPLIVKPNREGSGKGIWADSVVMNEQALKAQVEKVFRLYAQEVLVEEYIEGMELTVAILGADEALPILEIDFSECTASGESFYSWRMKEFQGNQELHLTPRFWCPARLAPTVAAGCQAVAGKAAKALGTRDVVRVDIRLSSDGIPYVLEVNPLPGLDPEESNLPLMAQAAGISYEELLKRIVHCAVARSPRLSHHSLTDPKLSIPSSKTTLPVAKAPRRRALPDSKPKESGSSGDPVVAGRNHPGRRGETRQDDSKEERLGP